MKTMTETLTVTYLNCGYCTAKNHCAACGGELSAALEQKPGIARARLDIPDHTLLVEHSMEGGALEDLLDGMGLLVG